MNNDNLKSYKQGESGNPSGRPKGTCNSKTVIETFLKMGIKWKDIEGKPKNMTIIDAMHIEQIRKALKRGDTRAYIAVLERFEGKPKQQIEQDIKTVVKVPMIRIDGKPLEHNIGEKVYDNEGE